MIESLISLAVMTVVAGVGVPGFGQMLERRQLDAAAAQIRTDLQHARSLAVAQNRSLRIGFGSHAGGSCYIVHTGGAGDCECGADGLPVCQAGAVALRSEHFAADRAVQLSSNVASMVLDPAKGTVSPTGTLRVTATGARAVHVVVNIMGRARMCSPAAGVPGYPRC